MGQPIAAFLCYIYKLMLFIYIWYLYDYIMFF